jgi:hypothetical protein
MEPFIRKINGEGVGVQATVTTKYNLFPSLAVETIAPSFFIVIII